MARKPNSTKPVETTPDLQANSEDMGAVFPKDSILDGDDTDDYTPEGYDSAEDFLKEMRDNFTADSSFDLRNREWAMEDLKFAAGDQWDPIVRAEREEMGRPCLTINTLPQFVGQVIGDRRLNETSIVVRPYKDGTEEVAAIRTGLIKSIENYSRAERVYDLACEDQVICGISNMRVDLEYAGNDVFDQDVLVRHIPNPLAVVWDRMSVDPTGRDARHCFVNDTMPRDVYNKTWPKCPSPTALQDLTMQDMTMQGWFDKDIVRITEYWRLKDKPATFALLMDGKVVDITDGMEAAGVTPEMIYRDPKTGKPRIRKSYRTYAQMNLCTGFAILSKTYEIPLTRLPIIRVEGRVIRVAEDRVRFGLVRFAKDSQRLKNYWRSVAAETIALAPKAVWIAPSDALEGREDDFRSAHRSGDPLLLFNKNASVPPTRVEPAQIPAALLNEAQMNQQDIKDTTGLQDASLGIQSNEVSGKAINARKKEGDIATMIYQDNLNWSIQEVGDVMNQLIPIAYDTIRTIRVIGIDDQQKLMAINDPTDPDAIDITLGKYDVTVETGPSFTTQREEAANAMLTIVQTSPEIMAVAGDLIVGAQDWPWAQKIAARLKGTIPPQILQADGEDNGAQNPTAPGAQPQSGPQPDPNSPQGQMAAQAQQLQSMAVQNQIAELSHAQDIRQYKQATMEADARKAAISVSEAQANAERAQAEAHHAKVRAGLALPQGLAKLHNEQEKHEHIMGTGQDGHIIDMFGKVQGMEHAQEKHDVGVVQTIHGASLAHDSAQQQREHGERKMGLAERAASAKTTPQRGAGNKRPQRSGQKKGK